MKQASLIANTSQQQQQGLLFIPDISGYTRLVKELDLETGNNICMQLLSTIIDANRLEMNVVEIEGDAVLFFKPGMAPDATIILKQYEAMLENFHSKVLELNRQYGIHMKLSLKVIAHYGTVATYRLAGFQKIYGTVVIEAHRLLKNGIQSNQYILLTNELLNNYDNKALLPPAIVNGAGHLCEKYSDMPNLCFTYLDYSANTRFLKVA